ncbi:MAG: leucyl/phenylalanyl-tRNA--protein transferase [Treponema sp.]|nr:leucyl/phenylalanyl-tRNA--protein transferase [Treponema sp.]
MEYERFCFPQAEEAGGSVVALGGNLSPGMLLSAYEQGIFPWYNQEDPILWQSPDPRFIILPQGLHVSASMERALKRGDFEIALDRDFPAIIRGCAAMPRPGQEGTWITGDIIAAYERMHRLGWVHSAESYQDGELAGGCYGMRLGKVFFGESMFARRANASKAAFLALARLLFQDGLAFIDCQVPTPHLQSLGGTAVGRRDFIRLLRETLADRDREGVRDQADRRGNWGKYYGYP